MTDAEWAALPVEIRMWAIEQGVLSLGGRIPYPYDADGIAEAARTVAAVLIKAPEVEDVAVEPQARNFRQERGLSG